MSRSSASSLNPAGTTTSGQGRPLAPAPQKWLISGPGFSPAAYTEALAKYRVTSAFAIPTMFARVVKELAVRDDLDLSAIKQIVLASAPLTLAMIDRVRTAIPSATVGNNYGTTEAGAAVFGKHPKGVATPDLSLGYPVPGSDVKLVDGPDENQGTLLMRNPALIYKIATRDVAEAARAAGTFTGMPVDLADGYLHFSTAAQLPETLRLWFKGQGDLALFAVSSGDMGALLHWEPSRGGQLFPHVYGTFPMSAVVSAPGTAGVGSPARRRASSSRRARSSDASS